MMPPPRGVVKAKSAVSSILHSIMTSTFDLLTPKCDTIISVPQHIVDVSLVKILEKNYLARYCVNNVSGCIYAYMHARTSRTKMVSLRCFIHQ